MHNFEYFGLGDVVPRSTAKGKRIIKGRWVLAKRADDWRCRWVCKDFRAFSPDQEGLFTPSSHPDTGTVIDCKAVKTGKPTRVADAVNAYWQVPETEEVYTECPDELKQQLAAEGKDSDVVFRNRMKQYGKRDASCAFADWLSEHFGALDFERCLDSPCFFRHVERDYTIEVHQDDFHECADECELAWFKDAITARGVELKWSEPIFPCGESYSHLKCKRIRTPTGTWIPGNNKYANEVISTLGMQDCKPAPTPCVSTREAEGDGGDLLIGDEAYKFRKCVGLLRFLRRYRGEINFTVKELSRGLARPHAKDMVRLKRCARYLKGHMNVARWFPVEGATDELDGYVDSDWAGEKDTRKSTSSYTVMLGGCNLTDSAKSQEPTATSSGEAEWYSACGGAAVAIHVHKICEFIFMKKIRLVLHTDSTVCKSIGHRQGCGRIKHLETKSLWLQQKIKRKDLYLRKVDTKLNPADMGTKPLAGPSFEASMKLNGYYQMPDGQSVIEKAAVKHNAVVGGIGGDLQSSVRKLNLSESDAHLIERIVKCVVMCMCACGSEGSSDSRVSGQSEDSRMHGTRNRRKAK